MQIGQTDELLGRKNCKDVLVFESMESCYIDGVAKKSELKINDLKT